jgi:hypothetical protein
MKVNKQEAGNSNGKPHYVYKAMNPMSKKGSDRYYEKVPDHKSL